MAVPIKVIHLYTGRLFNMVMNPAYSRVQEALQAVRKQRQMMIFKESNECMMKIARTKRLGEALPSSSVTLKSHMELPDQNRTLN